MSDAMRTRTRSHLVSLYLLLNWTLHAYGGFEPIDLAAKSYNADVVVEKTAPAPVIPVTTASMEEGTANLGTTWFERGYVKEWPATGLPQAGYVLASDLQADHQYQMPFSYK